MSCTDGSAYIGVKIRLSIYDGGTSTAPPLLQPASIPLSRPPLSSTSGSGHPAVYLTPLGRLGHRACKRPWLRRLILPFVSLLYSPSLCSHSSSIHRFTINLEILLIACPALYLVHICQRGTYLFPYPDSRHLPCPSLRTSSHRRRGSCVPKIAAVSQLCYTVWKLEALYHSAFIHVSCFRRRLGLLACHIQRSRLLSPPAV